ncbi:unnamed protein product, partial [Polarella glacialis]
SSGSRAAAAGARKPPACASPSPYPSARQAGAWSEVSTAAPSTAGGDDDFLADGFASPAAAAGGTSSRAGCIIVKW